MIFLILLMLICCKFVLYIGEEVISISIYQWGETGLFPPTDWKRQDLNVYWVLKKNRLLLSRHNCVTKIV